MIRVTVEHITETLENPTRISLGAFEISNSGKGRIDGTNNYAVWALARDLSRNDLIGEIKDFKAKNGFWALVKFALGFARLPVLAPETEGEPVAEAE